MALKKNRIKIHDWNGVAVLDFGRVEIWDGADLALLRETLVNTIERNRIRSIGVNMRYVKYIPSGFFGMLYDWNETGVDIRLYSPQPNVQMMLWFRQFCEHEADGVFRLLRQSRQQLRLPGQPTWKEPVWVQTEVIQPTPEPVEVEDNEWSTV